MPEAGDKRMSDGPKWNFTALIAASIDRLTAAYRRRQIEKTDEQALRDLLAGPESATIPGAISRRLKARGLITLHGCSDGDYVELTAGGRAALGDGS